MKKKLTKKKTVPKRRGMFLTVMIGIGLMAIVGAFYDIFILHGDQWIRSIMPFWYQWYMVIQLILKGISLYGIFTWKKWGIYVLYVSCIMSIPVGFVAVPEILNASSKLVSLLPLLILVLWYLAIRGKWNYFK